MNLLISNELSQSSIGYRFVCCPERVGFILFLKTRHRMRKRTLFPVEESSHERKPSNHRCLNYKLIRFAADLTRIGGYHTAARIYEFYFRVGKITFYERAH